MRPAELLTAIEKFIRTAAQPALVESGVGILPLQGNYEMQIQGGGIRFHVWGDAANLTRRVVGIREAKSGRLTLEIERFGKQRGTWMLVDQRRASNQSIRQRSDRHLFAEHFRAFLGRQFAGWEMAQLSTAPDLEHSLSPAYPRAMVTQGTKAWAAIAAPPGPSAADGVLTFGLVWLDYLRQRVSQRTLVGLAVFLPAGTETVTCLRMRWLNPHALQAAVFTYDAEFFEQAIDIRQGNLVTALDAANSAFAPIDSPEGRLEMAIRANVTAIDGTLLAAPVYGQVPAFAGRDRGILDLLAVDSTGRLAVLELKASEDIHLPIQALDYWMRVAWHAERGDFERFGYFPGVRLLPVPPRLLLVSPALHFHPTTEAVLRFFSPSIEVERVGIATEWRPLQSRTEQVHVVFRLHGWREPWHVKEDGQIVNG